MSIAARTRSVSNSLVRVEFHLRFDKAINHAVRVRLNASSIGGEGSASGQDVYVDVSGPAYRGAETVAGRTAVEVQFRIAEVDERVAHVFGLGCDRRGGQQQGANHGIQDLHDQIFLC